MGADVVLRRAADCVRVAVTKRIGFVVVVCCFLRFGISFSSSGMFRALFFYVFLNDRKRIKKNANHPFRSCGFRCLFAACARDVKL